MAGRVRCAKPLPLPKGTTLSMTITYDNSAANPRNPWNPPRQVFWGQRSADEMGRRVVPGVDASTRDFETLTAAFRPKVLAEDVVGYEREMTREPSSAGLHDSAACCISSSAMPRRCWSTSANRRGSSRRVASAHFNLGTALSINNRLDQAATEFARALELRPDYAQAHNNLGTILRQRGELDQARSHFQDAVRLDPGNAEAHRNLGAVSRDSGDSAGAVAHYREALKARPDWPAAMADLAWTLATSANASVREPGEAIRLAEQTLRVTGGDPLVLDVLAAAYASAGDFGRAVRRAESAVRAAPPGPTADAIRSRLELYRRARRFSPDEPAQRVDARAGFA